MQNTKSLVWYREPWPWILMLLPLSAVVASMTSLWLALKSDDGLVTDDYYKDGMSINKTLDRDLAAQALDLRAELQLEGQALHVKLSGKLTPLPETLQLSLAHPTHSGHDQRITLRQTAPGLYSTNALPSLNGVRWHVLLEAPQADWRLIGHWPAGEQIIHLGESKKSE